MKSSVSIRFLGAAGTVTGSKYLLQVKDKSILIDCGLFQGLKNLRLMNWQPLPIEGDAIDLILITHGHLDHVGYLPRIVQDGFKGEIWGTSPTLQIAKLILEDSAKIQEEDAARANRYGYSKHKKALPLYDLKAVSRTIPHFRNQPLNQWMEIAPGLRVRFKYNGHILGATYLEVQVDDQVIVFSGDIGRLNDPLLFSPEGPQKANVIVMESTYGDRVHPGDTSERLADIINRSLINEGTIIVPSFAVERTQVLMYLLWQLKKSKKIKDIPIYMDSPMGTNVLDVFHHNPSWHRLSVEDCSAMCESIVRVKTLDETLRLASDHRSKIIIAGSGMASGGRVLTYLEHYLGNEKATILLAGYQGEGTRGRQLLEGAQEIKLYGKYYQVRASVENIEGLSAHADQTELLHWLNKLTSAPEKIFITHGESSSSIALQKKILDTYGWSSVIPKLDQTVELGEAGWRHSTTDIKD